MKTLLCSLICLTAALAHAGPKKAAPKVPAAKNVYTAVGGTVLRGVASDGTVYYAFQCVNIKGEVIVVGIRADYIKTIKMDQEQEGISYK